MKWISVKDRLPPNTIVKMLSYDKKIIEAYYNGLIICNYPIGIEKNKNLSEAGGFGFTHWKPLKEKNEHSKI